MALPCALLAFFLFAPPEDSLAQGLKALDANDPVSAEPLLRQAATAEPNDFSIHFNLALALSMQQKDADAIAEFRRTLELKPALPQADLNLGMLLLRNKRPAEALPVLKEAAESGKSARADLYYAQALFDTGEVAQADPVYRAAVELDPKSAAAQAGLAHCLLTESKLPEAAEHFREAATLDPQYRSELLGLAAEYEKAGTVAEAIAIYRQFPDDPAAQERLSRLLVDNGNLSDAIPKLELLVKTTPSLLNRLALADAYKLNKQTDREIEQLQLAAAAEPSNFDLRMGLARELRDAHKPVEAAQQFSTAAKLRPDSVKAWNELATVYVTNHDYADGLAALDRVRALGKEIPGDFFFRGICLDGMHQLKPAIEAYRQFLATDGGKMADQEFQARQRIRIMENELNRAR